MLTPPQNKLYMKTIPLRAGKQLFQISFHPFHGLTTTEPPATSQAKNVRIDRERRVTERLSHHYTGRFMPHSGQSLKRLEGVGHPSPVKFYQLLCRSDQTPGFCFGQSAGGNIFPHLLPTHGRHFFRGGSGFKKCGCHLIYACIRTLGRQHYCHQQCKRITMMQRAPRFRICPLQLLQYNRCPLSSQH